MKARRESAICIVGPNHGLPDEGVSKVFRELSSQISKSRQLLTLSVRDLFNPRVLWHIRKAGPFNIIYTPGISVASIGLLSLLRRVFRPHCLAVLALHPRGPLLRAALKHARIDLVFVQSCAMEKLLEDAGIPAYVLPLGVDTDIFAPCSPKERLAIRTRFGFVKNRPVALHVGPLKRNRSVQDLARLIPEFQVCIVGSVSAGIDSKLAGLLRRRGVHLILEFIPDIEKIYASADVYVFPCRDSSASIELPLSVLEAMACNVPVVTTRFGALPRFLNGLNGVQYFDTPAALQEACLMALNYCSLELRERVLSMNWSNIAMELLHALEEKAGPE